MSKTVSTCILETNQLQNQPQENVFFHSLYRTQADFPAEFLRTARSTSPIQIVAIFSTSGPDNLSAMLNMELNQELGRIVSSTQNQPVLDFEAFSNQVVNVLNVKVCNYVVAKGGTPLKTSMTMLIIEGDTLRVIHIGNTKAVLIRDNKIMALTEEQTVAHRYVQMGAITPEQEKDHPESNNLTQYLGKLPQDGPVTPDKKVHLKLKDNDELCLMGLGISRTMPAQMRNVILVRPSQTETKARELLNSAYNYGVKSGLSVVMMQVESTFLLPGDAVINSNIPSDGTIARAAAKEEEKPYKEFSEPFGTADDDDDSEGTKSFNRGNLMQDEYKPNAAGKKKKGKTKAGDILVPIIIFLVFIGIGYGAMYLVFNAKHLIDKVVPESLEETDAPSRVMYITTDNTPVYVESSLESTVIASLSRGDSVTFVENIDAFSKIITSNGLEGFVLTVQISDDDPTIGEDLPEREEDPTPAPTEATTEATTAQTTQATETTAAQMTESTTQATEQTQATLATETTAATDEAIETSATSENTEATSETSATEASVSETEATAAEPQQSETAAPVEDTAAQAENP